MSIGGGGGFASEGDWSASEGVGLPLRGYASEGGLILKKESPSRVTSRGSVSIQGKQGMFQGEGVAKTPQYLHLVVANPTLTRYASC